jgi:hypothetical protein
MRREVLQRFFVVLHGTLGSYLRDALHEGGATLVACLPAPSSYAFVHACFLSFFAGGFHYSPCN